MNKKSKKICAIALAAAITAVSAINISVSADSTVNDKASIILKLGEMYSPVVVGEPDYTIVEEKGLMTSIDGTSSNNKVAYNDKNNELYFAEQKSNLLQFVLREDVDYEKVNDKIIEIFKEFYPENYLDVERPKLIDGLHWSDSWDDYIDNYKPELSVVKTVDGLTIYTVCVSYVGSRTLDGAKIEAAKKCSMDFMRKLNEEKLISAFYDFGEVYYFYRIRMNDCSIPDENVDLINNYIKENNLNCSIERKQNDNKLTFNNGISELEKFIIERDIYVDTSLRFVDIVPVLRPYDQMLCNKNSLEEISDVTNSKEVKISGDANGDDKITIKDCMFIARKLANREGADLPESADYNLDGKKNIKDAAAIAIDIANRKI